VRVVLLQPPCVLVIAAASVDVPQCNEKRERGTLGMSCDRFFDGMSSRLRNVVPAANSKHVIPCGAGHAAVRPGLAALLLHMKGGCALFTQTKNLR